MHLRYSSLLFLILLLALLSSQISSSGYEPSCNAIPNPADTASKLIVAILKANDNVSCPAADVIDLGGATIVLSTIYETYQVGTTGLPHIISDITIQNGSIERMNGISAFRFLYVASGSHLTLSKVTLRNGSTTAIGSGDGGAIFNQGTLTIHDSTFDNNSALEDGGAIENEGTLTINNSTFSANQAMDDTGAIFNDQGATATISNSVFSANVAADDNGAIFNWGTMTINDSTFIDNVASARGGAIFNGATAGSSVSELEITDSTFAGNQAQHGGALYGFRSNLTLIGAEFRGNDVSGNGGALYLDRYTDNIIVNGLFSGNQAADSGGALLINIGDTRDEITVAVTNSTFSGNKALYGGVLSQIGGLLRVQNSIAWGNDGAQAIHIDSSANAGSYFYDSLLEGGEPPHDDYSSNVFDTVPLFVDAPPAIQAPFTSGDYRIYTGSATIDAGNNNAALDFDNATDYTLADISTDLNGDARIQNAIVNLGAYETVVQPDQNNLLTNPYFATNLNGWSFSGTLSRTWNNGAVDIYRTGWKIPVMYQIVNTQLLTGSVLQAQAQLTNQSNVPKTVMLVLRSDTYEQQLICSVTLNPGQTTNLMLRGVTTQTWPLIHYAIRTFDRDNIPSIRVDNTVLQKRDDLTVTETTCMGNYPSTYTNYLLNGSFSYTGWRYWIRYGDILGTLSEGHLKMYRPTTNIGLVFHNLYQYFPKDTPIELTLSLQNTGTTSKSVGVLLRDEVWAQHLLCNIHVGAGETRDATMRLVTNAAWGSSVVSVRPLENDIAPNIVLDNVIVQAVASHTGNACSSVVTGDNASITLEPISAPPYIRGETVQFTLNGASDGVTVMLDCDGDSLFEHEGLHCPIEHETISAQVIDASGQTLTLDLLLEMMTPTETLTHLQADAEADIASALAAVNDLLTIGDTQSSFTNLMQIAQESNDPTLTAWLNRLAYTLQRDN